MESTTMGDHEDRFINLVEEDDPQNQDVGPVVRSYGCIFCRRGFTTAQALGGHMNIHRKDRAKSRPIYLSGNNSNNQENHSLYANHRIYHPVLARCSQTMDNQEGKPYLSTTSSTSQLVNHEKSHQDCYGVIKSPLMEEKTMNLSLQFGWIDGEDNRESRRRTRGGRNEDEPDLELRLGHDP